jgi:hypothetical protein
MPQRIVLPAAGGVNAVTRVGRAPPPAAFDVDLGFDSSS